MVKAKVATTLLSAGVPCAPAAGSPALAKDGVRATWNA
jgi:hypothetical protein